MQREQPRRDGHRHPLPGRTLHLREHGPFHLHRVELLERSSFILILIQQLKLEEGNVKVASKAQDKRNVKFFDSILDFVVVPSIGRWW